MDFSLSDEQRNLIDLAHGFAAKEMRPVAWEYDRSATWPGEIIARAWEAGLVNPHVPAAYGGPELSVLDGVLVEEQLAWGCVGIHNSLGCNTLPTWALLLGGSEMLKRRYLGMLIERPALAALAQTEPEAGSDVASMRTRAVRRGSGWAIDGTKCFITNASHADWFVVYAKTDPAGGHRGISAFVVPREAGIRVDGKEDKMGQRASDTATVVLDGVEVPADHLIGEENQGFRLAMTVLDRTRPNVAAMAVGVAQAAFEFARDYARERHQFGVPIGRHQVIEAMIADMATKTQAARLLTYQAAAIRDAGGDNTLLASHAKRFAGDTAMEVTTDAVQVHGGYGYMRDYPVEKLMRDAKLLQLYEGTSQIQRVIIGRRILAEDKASSTGDSGRGRV